MRVLIACLIVLLVLTGAALAQQADTTITGEPATHWWQNWRLLQIAVTGGMAFLGFTLGTLIKFGCDLWLEAIRERKRARLIALELKAEVETFDDVLVICFRYLRNFRKTPELESTIGVKPYFSSVMYIPPSRCYNAYIGSLALLDNYDLPQRLVSFYTNLDRRRSLFGGLSQVEPFEDSGAAKEQLDRMEYWIDQLRRVIPRLREDLLKFAEKKTNGEFEFVPAEEQILKWAEKYERSSDVKHPAEPLH
jgi:hypothetical protein